MKKNQSLFSMHVFIGLARAVVYRLLTACLVIFIYSFGIQQAHASTLYCTTSSYSYSPALTSPMYFSASYSADVPVVVYSGVLSWTIGSCTNLQNYLGTVSIQTGTVNNIPGLTVASAAVPGTTSATCSNGKIWTMQNSQSYNGFIMPASGVTCTYNLPFTISTNAAVSSSSTGTVTAAQLVSSPTDTTGWARAGGYFYPNSSSTTTLTAKGLAITFIPRSCTITSPSQTITLPSTSTGILNSTGYSAWTNWSIALTNCTNMAAAGSTVASVTFSYTELGTAGSKIIAPDATSTSTNVGIQIGYNDTALASGTAQSLSTISSSGATYTMQARYAKSSGTATDGSVKNASASYIVTYN